MTESKSWPTFDLILMESDDTPTFVIRVGPTVLQFDLLYANRAFRDGHFREAILAENRQALLFRSWAQALGQPVESQHEHAGYIWSTRVAPTNGMLKAISATKRLSQEETFETNQGNKLHDSTSNPWAQGEEAFHTQMNVQYKHKPYHDQLPVLSRLPRTNLIARWEGIQIMMELSDVGVFEYNKDGTLMHANEAWYKLRYVYPWHAKVYERTCLHSHSSHPKDPLGHENFLFMDLVYPEDQPMIMSMWNTLIQGSPVTFEMRWKPRLEDGDVPTWVLSACVPIFDEDDALISIAGSTIDISTQKKAQEATQARVEALEQVRASEMRFIRFAQLSPTAIYIFVPEVGKFCLDYRQTTVTLGTLTSLAGMQFVNDQFYELTGHPLAPIDQSGWFSLVAEEDVHKVETDWAEMLKGRRSDGLQFRLKKTWYNQDGVKDNIWVHSSSSPQLDEQDNVQSTLTRDP
jgi:PAS domain-containing protein